MESVQEDILQTLSWPDALNAKKLVPRVWMVKKNQSVLMLPPEWKREQYTLLLKMFSLKSQVWKMPRPSL